MLDNKVWLYRIFWCLYNRVWQGSVKPFYSGYIGRKWPHNQSCWDLWEVISQVEVIMFWIIYCDTYCSSYKEQTSAGATHLSAGGSRRQLLCPDRDTPKVPSCQLQVGKLAPCTLLYPDSRTQTQIFTAVRALTFSHCKGLSDWVTSIAWKVSQDHWQIPQNWTW